MPSSSRSPHRFLFDVARSRARARGIVIYFYLLFLSPWCWLTIQVSAILAVGGILLIVAWIGYTLATTPPPIPLEDFDIDTDADTTG